MRQTYYQSKTAKMASIPHSHSREITPYSHLSSNFHSNNPESFQLKQFWFKKSLFNHPPGLAQTFAARRHLAGVEVPRIQIIHCSPRWLLLQAPQAKASFFDKLKKGKLGNREQQILKLFKSFAALIQFYGFFRPTQKMIFMERTEFRVWINEDIFSNDPLMPISQGRESQKHFVISFLAMLQASLQEWQRLANVLTIEQTIKALQWRCRLARGSRTAVNASLCTNFKPEESHVSFNQSQLYNANNIASSQQLQYHTAIENVRPALSNSFTLNEACEFNKAKDVRLVKKSVQFQIAEAEEQGSIRHTKKKFALHSTSSTIGNFSEKFRSTAGRKKLLERAQSLEQKAPISSLQIPTIQTQFQDLFAEERKQLPGGCNEEQLERIAEEMQEVLIW